MEERFSISYKQAYPRVPRVPSGLVSSEFNSRLGLTQGATMKARSRIFLLTLFLIVGLRPSQKLTASTSQAVAQLSAPVRISDDNGDDEDPSVLLARDGRFYVAWLSKRLNGGNIYIKSSEEGRTWSAEERVTIGPGEDYYPSISQTRHATFPIPCR